MSWSAFLAGVLASTSSLPAGVLSDGGGAAVAWTLLLVGTEGIGTGAAFRQGLVGFLLVLAVAFLFVVLTRTVGGKDSRVLVAYSWSSLRVGLLLNSVYFVSYPVIVFALSPWVTAGYGDDRRQRTEPEDGSALAQRVSALSTRVEDLSNRVDGLTRACGVECTSGGADAGLRRRPPDNTISNPEN